MARTLLQGVGRASWPASLVPNSAIVELINLCDNLLALVSIALAWDVLRPEPYGLGAGEGARATQIRHL